MGVLTRMYKIVRNKVILLSTPVSNEEFKQFKLKKKEELAIINAEVERGVGISSEELKRQKIESIRNQILEHPGLIRKMIWVFSGFLHWLKPYLSNLKNWVSENYAGSGGINLLILIFLATFTWITYFSIKTGLGWNFFLLTGISSAIIAIIVNSFFNYEDKKISLKNFKQNAMIAQTVYIILVFILTNLYVVSPSSSFIGIQKSSGQFMAIDYSTSHFFSPWDEKVYFNTVFYDKEFSVTAEKEFKMQEEDFFVRASLTAILDSERSAGLFRDGELVTQAAEEEAVKKYLETVLDEQIKSLIKNRSVNEFIGKTKSLYQDLRASIPYTTQPFSNHDLGRLTVILLNSTLEKQMEEKTPAKSEACCYEISEEIQARVYHK